MKKILFSVAVMMMGVSILGALGAWGAAPVYAADDPNCVPTAILGDGHQVCDSGNGDSVIRILNLVASIMTVGVGILGVLGITIVGIQYLTAGGSEEKTRKAKRRMFEIVLGLVAYVVIYAALSWLLPEFQPFSGS